MSDRLFGTDGIRGLANQYPITADLALQLGKAIALLFRDKGLGKIVIGKDTRRSNYMIENALSAGICSMGVNSIFLGPIPTPGIAYLTQSMRADAGVVISASHNPYYDNGIKLFNHDGFKLADSLEDKIALMIEKQNFPDGPLHEKIGKAKRVDDAKGRYITFLKNTFPKELDLEGFKIVVDCANGAAYEIAPVIFEELGAEVIALGIDPNGTNINEQCGALYPEKLAKKVLKENAHLGIALDGDADRVIMIDEKGRIVDGDHILAFCAQYLKKKKKLKKNTVVATIMSNMGFELWLKSQDIHLLRAQVGDRYVMETMLKNKLNFGGEQSGHIIFLDHNTTGDGLLSALKVLEVMKEEGKTLSELAHLFETFPQATVKVKVRERKAWENIPSCKSLVRKIEKELSGKGRLVLRYSGTEPVFRIMIEGENDKKIQTYLKDLEDQFTLELGA